MTLVAVILLLVLMATAMYLAYRLTLPRPFTTGAVVIVLWLMNRVLGEPFGEWVAWSLGAAAAFILTILFWYVARLNYLMLRGRGRRRT